jgi:LDH2 family malate/lactate/ureidoglycolate dehydrogenase
LIEEIHGSATADGCDSVLLPGQREWEHRRRALVDGLQLPVDVLTVLQELALSLGLDPLE